jgi:hypothetical protein
MAHLAQAGKPGQSRLSDDPCRELRREQLARSVERVHVYAAGLGEDVVGQRLDHALGAVVALEPVVHDRYRPTGPGGGVAAHRSPA